MARIVIIHGIGQQMEGENTLRAGLFPALRDGMSRGGVDVSPEDVSFASYGEVFRPASEFLAPTAYYDEFDVESGYEEQLLIALWRRAAESDETILPPDEEVLLSAPSIVRRALAAISKSPFLANVAERSFIGDLKQVRMYFCNSDLRAKVQDRVATAITKDTRVIVAHSLGSVVAYEVLCSRPYWPVRALVTLGSPLGVRNLIFDRLQPRPTTDVATGQLIGLWPPVSMWTNIADETDIVAAVEDLRPLFGNKLRQIRVHNAPKVHDMRSYLTDSLTGYSISAGLNG